MAYTYNGCTNLYGNSYFYSNQVSNAFRCFDGRNIFNILNIYAPANSTTMTTLLRDDSKSIVGTAITWTDDMNTNGCYYNTMYNIYIYPVANVAATRLENEFDINLQLLSHDKDTIVDNDSALVKTVWEYNAIEMTIDSGKAFSMPIDIGSLDGVTIEKVEVK